MDRKSFGETELGIMKVISDISKSGENAGPLQIARAVGISYPTLISHKKRLCEQGYLAKDGTYSLTELGKRVAGYFDKLETSGLDKNAYTACDFMKCALKAHDDTGIISIIRSRPEVESIVERRTHERMKLEVLKSLEDAGQKGLSPARLSYSVRTNSDVIDRYVKEAEEEGYVSHTDVKKFDKTVPWYCITEKGKNWLIGSPERIFFSKVVTGE